MVAVASSPTAEAKFGVLFRTGSVPTDESLVGGDDGVEFVESLESESFAGETVPRRGAPGG
jgi:hypothetical protein